MKGFECHQQNSEVDPLCNMGRQLKQQGCDMVGGLGTAMMRAAECWRCWSRWMSLLGIPSRMVLQ